MATINWRVSPEDNAAILAIAERVDRDRLFDDQAFSRLEMIMDLTAVHANGCPLKLAELLEAEPFDFAHDIAGIQRHINRRTGQLEDCFLPRYSDTAARA